jgi:hypothetical protein
MTLGMQLLRGLETKLGNSMDCRLEATLLTSLERIVDFRLGSATDNAMDCSLSGTMVSSLADTMEISLETTLDPSMDFTPDA